MSIINLATNAMVGVVPVGQNPMSLIKNAENTRLYVIGTSSNDITVIDLANHTVVATIPLSNGAYFFGMAITKIALLDVYGRLLKTVAGDVRQIEMSDMAAGTYIVRIFEGEKRSAACRVQKLK